MIFKEGYKRFGSFVEGYRGYNGRVRYFILGIFLALAAFFILLDFMAHYVRHGEWGIDLKVNSLMAHYRSESLTQVVKGITYSGNLVPMLVLTLGAVALLAYIKRRGEGLFFAGNVLGVWLFNALLKLSFKRPRPEGLRLVEVEGYSFPSGHAMTFMGLALIAVYFVLAYVKHRGAALAISAVFLSYAILVGLSRVYLGVHYFSDVAAGWAAGALWVSGSVLVFRYIGYKRYRVK